MASAVVHNTQGGKTMGTSVKISNRDKLLGLAAAFFALLFIAACILGLLFISKSIAASVISTENQSASVIKLLPTEAPEEIGRAHV